MPFKPSLHSRTRHFMVSLKGDTFDIFRGWSGCAMVLGKLPVPGRPTIWITVGQGPTALAVGAGGGCLDIFTLISPFSPLSPSLWETTRYRLKYCLKGSLSPKSSKQPTRPKNEKRKKNANIDKRSRKNRPVNRMKSAFPNRCSLSYPALAVGRVGVVWTFLLSSIISFPDID